MGRQRLVRDKVLHRIVVAALAFALVTAQLAAELSLSRLHDHDCAGPECVICHVLGLAKALLNSAADSPVVSHGPDPTAHVRMCMSTLRDLARAAQTPVTLKVCLID